MNRATYSWDLLPRPPRRRRRRGPRRSGSPASSAPTPRRSRRRRPATRRPCCSSARARRRAPGPRSRPPPRARRRASSASSSRPARHLCTNPPRAEEEGAGEGRGERMPAPSLDPHAICAQSSASGGGGRGGRPGRADARPPQAAPDYWLAAARRRCPWIVHCPPVCLRASVRAPVPQRQRAHTLCQS